MDIKARVVNAPGSHQVVVGTDGVDKVVTIPPKAVGAGSSVNGGELLLLALATCYCNDVYREARKRGLAVTGVEVEARAEFGGEGEPARRLEYDVRVSGDASEADLRDLMAATDRVTEIQNTVRQGLPVVLARAEVVRG